MGSRHGRTWPVWAALLLVCGTGGTAGLPLSGPAHAASAPVSLGGAGSTFDAPFFDAAFAAYSRTHALTVTYRAVGSGAGSALFTAGRVDFAASDVPLNGAELARANAGGNKVVQVPVVLGAVAVIFTLPPAAGSGALHLDGPTLASIFLGRITRWNDPALQRQNPSLRLPALPITPVHRSDSSGTTYIFTDYLSAADARWRGQAGKGKLIRWTGGVAAHGTDGVAAEVAARPGAIGYVELRFAFNNRMRFAQLRNAAGTYVEPNRQTVLAAAAQFPHIRGTRFSIIDAPGRQSYPIAGYSWVLLRSHQPDASKGNALITLLTWLANRGQQYAAAQNYVPLPVAAQTLTLHDLATISVG